MSNQDSFHNGPENLELQTKNMAAAPKVETYQETADHLNLPAHQRPYVNIYDSSNRQSCTAGGKEILEETRNASRVLTPEQAGYTNVYNQRVADRSEPSDPGQFGNENNNGTTPYYGDAPASLPYDTTDDDNSAEFSRKKKLSLAALILGISSFAGNICCLTCLTPFTAILAIIFGCVGRIGGKFETKGLIGMILGIVYCGIMILLILYIVFIGMLMGPDESVYTTVY